jgi:ABC-type multidrug transport system fused ATPase/permease subunit
MYNSSLSIGEKQKIGIARALLRKPRILLLDEAFSFLDEETTAVIEERVFQYIKDNHVTCIIVTDDLKIIEKATKIYFLEEGNIAEKGPHNHLMGLKGRYYHMFIQQQSIRKYS